MAAIVRFGKRTREADQLGSIRTIRGILAIDAEQVTAGMFRLSCSPQAVRTCLEREGWVSTDVEVWATMDV